MPETLEERAWRIWKAVLLDGATVYEVTTELRAVAQSERDVGRREANDDWLSCLYARTGNTKFSELGGSVVNVDDALTEYKRAVRRKERDYLLRNCPGMAADKIAGASLPDCLGCTDPRSEGTHAEGTKQHPPLEAELRQVADVKYQEGRLDQRLEDEEHTREVTERVREIIADYSARASDLGKLEDAHFFPRRKVRKRS